MKKNRKKNRIRKFLIYFIIVTAILFLSFVIPKTRRSWTYNCRVCGMTKKVTKVYFAMVPVWSDKEMFKQSYTEYYDRHIGEEHEHQWTGGGRSVAFGNLLVWGYGTVGCGEFQFGPYPPNQIIITRWALYSLDDPPLCSKPVAFKKKLLYDLIDLQSEKEVESTVAKIQEQISQQEDARDCVPQPQI